MEDRSPNRLTALLVVGIVILGSNSFVLSPILTDVARAFDTTPVVIARVISAYGAATAISAFLFSGAVDRFGARIVLSATTAAMAAALGLSAASWSWQSLAFAQACVGLASGIMLPAIYATAIATASEANGARILGRVLTGWAISLVAGVPLSAFMTEYAGWRYAYGALACLSLIPLAGFLTLRLPAARSPGKRVSPLRAATTPGVPPLLFVCLAFMSAFYGTYAYLGDHVRTVLHVSAGDAGFVVLAYGAGFGLAGLGDSRVDRIGPARVFPFVLCAIAATYAVMIPAFHAYATALAIAFVWGLVNHYGLNILVLLLSRQRPDARGAVLGLHSTVTYTAVFAGPLLLGLAYARFGFDLVLGIAGLCAVSAALVAARCVHRWRASAAA